MSVRGITYNDGGNPIDYKEVTISTRETGDHKWNSGDFVRDWYFSTKFILMGGLNGEHGCHSSSVDHFVMDGAPYDSLYLVFGEDDKPSLTNQYDWDGDNIELFVPEGTQPTWEELREMCGDPVLKVGDIVSFMPDYDVITGMVDEIIDEEKERFVMVNCVEPVQGTIRIPFLDLIRPER